ncbi:hypothetical protein OURE66S_00228 [Oligella ureolytica]
MLPPCTLLIHRHCCRASATFTRYTCACHAVWLATDPWRINPAWPGCWEAEHSCPCTHSIKLWPVSPKLQEHMQLANNHSGGFPATARYLLAQFITLPLLLRIKTLPGMLHFAIIVPCSKQVQEPHLAVDPS